MVGSRTVDFVDRGICRCLSLSSNVPTTRTTKTLTGPTSQLGRKSEVVQVGRRTRPAAVDGREDHLAWLDLVEVNGPFLALPVLLRVWPTLDAVDRSTRDMLRIAHADGLIDSELWIDFVLRRLLEW